MRDQVQRTLFTIATAAATCGMAVASVYAGLGNVRLDPTVTLSSAGNYFPYCDPIIDPVGRHIHDALRDGDKWTRLGPFNCNILIRPGCLEVPGIKPSCFPGY
jgi:hypothetical protein